MSEDLRIRFRYALSFGCRYLWGHAWEPTTLDTTEAPVTRFFVLRGWGVSRCRHCHCVRMLNPEDS